MCREQNLTGRVSFDLTFQSICFSSLKFAQKKSKMRWKKTESFCSNCRCLLNVCFSVFNCFNYLLFGFIRVACVCVCLCLWSLGVTSSVQLAIGRHQNEWLRQRTWARQFVHMYAKGKEKLAQNEDAVAATDCLRRFQSINQSIFVKAELRECPSAWQDVLSQPLLLSECPRPSVIRIFQLTFRRGIFSRSPSDSIPNHPIPSHSIRSGSPRSGFYWWSTPNTIFAPMKQLHFVSFLMLAPLSVTRVETVASLRLPMWSTAGGLLRQKKSIRIQSNPYQSNGSESNHPPSSPKTPWLDNVNPILGILTLTITCVGWLG